MSSTTKEFLQNTMVFIVVMTGIIGFFWAVTKPNNPAPARQVQGGTIVQKDSCTWFVPKTGTNVILMQGRREFCHGNQPTVVIR